MRAIFISHGSKDARDAQDARDMAVWLRQQGYESLFLDVDPEAGLVAGKDWEHQLYVRLRGCRAVIVLCSQHSMSSRTHARSARTCFR